MGDGKGEGSIDERVKDGFGNEEMIARGSRNGEIMKSGLGEPGIDMETIGDSIRGEGNESRRWIVVETTKVKVKLNECTLLSSKLWSGEVSVDE